MNNAHTYEGFESFQNALKMRLKMVLYLIIFLIVSHLILTAFIFFLKSDPYTRKVTLRWIAARMMVDINPNGVTYFENADGSKVQTTFKTIVYSSIVSKIAKYELHQLKLIFFYSALIYLFFPFLIYKFRKRAVDQSAKQHLRGAALISEKDYSRIVKTQNIFCDLPIGQVKMPKDAETRHTFIVGSIGTGKTVSFSQILERIKDNNGKAIIHDYKGDYARQFYDPSTDLIFNPLDKRSINWNIFDEMQTVMDVESLGASLIPSLPGVKDPYWNNTARSVFVGGLNYLFKNDMKTNKNIWKFVSASDDFMAEALKSVEGGEAGYKAIKDTESQRTSSITSVLIDWVKCFQYLALMDSEGNFRIKDWLYDDNKKGCIFLTNYEDIADTLKPMLSLFIDMMGRRLLSMPEDVNRRVYFLIDEFGVLQALPTILKVLTLGRSKGASTFLGIQDVGQIEKIYDKVGRQTILGSCKNRVVFAVIDGETSKVMSESFGEEEVEDTNKSLTLGVTSHKDGENISKTKRTEKIILPSEIMSQPDLHCFVKFSGMPPFKTRWDFKKYENKHPAFIMREGLGMTDRHAQDQGEPPQQESEAKPSVNGGPKIEIALD